MLKKLLIAAVILTSSFGFSATEAAQTEENYCGRDSYCYENYNDKNCYDDNYCGGGYCGYGRGRGCR